MKERSEGEGVEGKVQEAVHSFHMLVFTVCMCSPYEPAKFNTVGWGEEEEGGG